ncbi:MAG: MBL fold metallo-hydrolase [Myxococcales bacterium]|nr:MBL fold metallo-hydrolase [Myxococcales bacterium]
MEVKEIFDPKTFTLTYVVYDSHTKDAVIIDPVLDFDPLTWRYATRSADAVDEVIKARALKVHWILDTHAHADHLSGMEVLKERFGAATAIGKEITFVQSYFKQIYNLPDTLPVDGRQWSRLLDDGDVLNAGSLSIKVLHTPGHTPACMSYVIGDAVFTGDALFMPDYGTGRCDFPNGSAEAMYRSVKEKLYTLPKETRVFVGHDYMPDGREMKFETTIAESMAYNVQLNERTTMAEFVSFRQKRDRLLDPPALILQSLQVNIDAGRMPPAEPNGRVYLKMPINFLGRS